MFIVYTDTYKLDKFLPLNQGDTLGSPTSGISALWYILTLFQKTRQYSERGQ